MAEHLAQTLDNHIDGLEIGSALRYRIAGGCLDMALEHHKAVVLLVARQLRGSAFSIMRLQFEAYVRGVWLHQCATDTELAAFTNEKLDHSFAALVSAIEGLDGFSDGALSKARRNSWAAMCSFIHTGFLQVVRRNRETTVEPDYNDDEVIEALGFANAIALLAALEIAHIAGAERLSVELLDLARNIATPVQ
tara:strand:- start:132 stop:710 length:579 start_codon:yes stop_codon:yes gene_type:complete